MKENILQKIIEELLQSGVKTRTDLDAFKRRAAKKYHVPCPKNTLLLQVYHKLQKSSKQKNTGKPKYLESSPLNMEQLLRKKPIRSLSGIVNVSILTKAFPCPHHCLFCPEEKGLPKSYLAKEPAVQRAVLNKFHPFGQVLTRLQSLKQTGHPVDKIELRIIGATWSCYPKEYQTWFLKQCFQAANRFSSKKYQPKTLKLSPTTPWRKYSRSRTALNKPSLKALQKQNETAKCRLVGITIETRPDYITLSEIKRLRLLGVTRVELGVQTIYNDVLKFNHRGHTIKETIKATELLKYAGFKVSYQMMPNLPRSTFQKDIQMFKTIFTKPQFKPDLLKIYPLAVVKQAPLYKLYQEKKFKPYSKKKLAKLLVEIKKQIPRWCRVERVIRDIPSSQIAQGGVKTSNLREVVQAQLKAQGHACKCIRCREVGVHYDPKEKLYLFREDYLASGGKEIFLSFENKTRSKLYALLRLRLCPASQPGFSGQVRLPISEVIEDRAPKEARPQDITKIFPVLKSAALIREVHTFGQLKPITYESSTPIDPMSNTAQHRGLGRKLMLEAEKIAKQAGFEKIAVIAGVGARPYYRKLGFRLRDTYMIKRISQ